jgi:hypothetical protein
MDLLYTANKRNVLLGREHPDGFQWKKSTCTFRVRCGQNHEVQGFFCNAPISFEKDMLFRTSIAYCQNTTEVDMELYERWTKRPIKRRIKKLNERTC